MFRTSLLPGRALRHAPWLGVALCVLLAGEARSQPATLKPTSVAGDARMVTFDFDDDRISKVLVRPRFATQLEFQAGEVVTYVSAGDKNDFVVTVPASR